MRKKVQYATREHIIGGGAVREFFYTCVHGLKLGIGFHPDTRFEDYIFKHGKNKDARVFTDEEAIELNKTMDECHNQNAIYNVDVYTIAMDIVKPLLEEKETRGGYREGSGRPKGKPTTTLSYRVPKKHAKKIDKEVRVVINKIVS